LILHVNLRNLGIFTWIYRMDSKKNHTRLRSHWEIYCGFSPDVDESRILFQAFALFYALKRQNMIAQGENPGNKIPPFSRPVRAKYSLIPDIQSK